MESITEHNFYEILQLPNFSDLKAIKIKYKELMKINHPDKGGNSDNFNKIRNAYENLNDSNKKSEFDRKLKYSTELYDKAEVIDISHLLNQSVDGYLNYECMQCFSDNIISNKNLKLNMEITNIVKCEYCSMIYKLIYN